MKKKPLNAVADLFVYANGGHTYRKYKEVKGINIWDALNLGVVQLKLKFASILIYFPS